MPDKILQFTAIIQILKKNIFLIFLTTIITTLIGCSYLFFLATPQYSSQTQVIAKVEAGIITLHLQDKSKPILRCQQQLLKL